MAWLFALWVQCDAAAEADAVATHFDGVIEQLGDGTAPRLDAARAALADPTCVWVVPTGVSRSGVSSARDARQLSELGHRLYDRLRTAPPFWFALAGIEVDDVRTPEDVDVLAVAGTDGVVITVERWRGLGRPAGFEPFRPGMMWRPYRGEPVAGGH